MAVGLPAGHIAVLLPKQPRTCDVGWARVR